jgi:DNA-binding NarL/FixJ family response regulator
VEGMRSTSMRVLIVDSNYLFRQGLKAILSSENNFDIVGEGTSVEQGINLIFSQKPDIAIIDLIIGREKGLKIVEEVKNKGIECKFMVLTNSFDYRDFKKVRESLVEGYILKDALPEEFIYALRIIKTGKKYYDSNLMISAINLEKEGYLDDEPLQSLTNREKEVLIALGKGLSNNDIASRLLITEFTVKKHVGQILYKLRLSDRTQAALYASSKGLV